VLLSRASRVIQISQIAIACSALSAEPAPKCPTHVKWPRRTMAWRRSRPTTVGYACGCRASQCLHYEAKRRSRSWLGARQKLASATYASSREFLDSLICHPCKTVITAGFHRAANLLRDDRLGSGTWGHLDRKTKGKLKISDRYIGTSSDPTSPRWLGCVRRSLNKPHSRRLRTSLSLLLW
jgi:hypothetical protein